MYRFIQKMIKTNSKNVISVANFLATIIGSRDVIDLLKPRILQIEDVSVILDFENVDFISRSAAHELLLIKEEVRSKNKELTFDNTNKDIAEMLRVVAANRALPKFERPNFNPEKTNIDSLMSNEVAI